MNKSNKANKRNELEKQRDRDLIKTLRLKRWSYRQIANHPELKHISLTQIYKDCQKVEEEWKKKTIIDVEFEKKKQLETLDWVISENSEAWEKSKEEKTKTSGKKRTGGKGAFSESGLIKESLTGDYGYHRTIIEAVKEQNKLLGLYPTVKTELSGKLQIDPIEINYIAPSETENKEEVILVEPDGED